VEVEGVRIRLDWIRTGLNRIGSTQRRDSVVLVGPCPCPCPRLRPRLGRSVGRWMGG
jgi:hypothetical protein